MAVIIEADPIYRNRSGKRHEGRILIEAVDRSHDGIPLYSHEGIAELFNREKKKVTARVSLGDFSDKVFTGGSYSDAEKQEWDKAISMLLGELRKKSGAK